MIKLDSISRWNHLPVGQRLTLNGDAPRRIRLNVNSPKRISLHLVNPETGVLQFLASPDGLEVVEFYACGVGHVLAFLKEQQERMP